MSEPKQPQKPPAPAPPPSKRPPDWQEEWHDEAPPREDPELEWEDEDTCDEDTDWEDEVLLEEQRAEDADDGWAPTEGDWEEELDWSDEPEQAREEEEDPLLDEIPQTPSIIGWKTRVDLPRWEVADVPARCSTDCADSTFHVEYHPAGDDRVRLLVQDREVEVAVSAESGELMIALEVLVAEKLFPLNLRLRATSGAPLVVLGRDALAGRFLIDVAG
jgi:hypothetical protein